MSNSLFIISGTLGAGKSSLSKLINSKLGFALVDGDSLFNPLENIKGLSWKNRLNITWNNIANVTREYLKNNLDVVIDFVVEDELNWFLEQIGDFNPNIKYCQLIADENTLSARLNERDGSTRYLERSKELLTKIKNDPAMKKYLIDTSGKSQSKVFELFIDNDEFKIK